LYALHLLLPPSSSHRHLPSFPTRRSSDLDSAAARITARRKIPFILLFFITIPAPKTVLIYIYAPERVSIGSNLSFYSPRTKCRLDRKSTRLNSSHVSISYAVFCLKKKKTT